MHMPITSKELVDKFLKQYNTHLDLLGNKERIQILLQSDDEIADHFISFLKQQKSHKLGLPSDNSDVFYKQCRVYYISTGHIKKITGNLTLERKVHQIIIDTAKELTKELKRFPLSAKENFLKKPEDELQTYFNDKLDENLNSKLTVSEKTQFNAQEQASVVHRLRHSYAKKFVEKVPKLLGAPASTVSSTGAISRNVHSLTQEEVTFV